jgi:hypothetical protein
MVPATCHPNRRHYAKGKCWPCYARLWNGNRIAKDGAWAKFRRTATHSIPTEAPNPRAEPDDEADVHPRTRGRDQAVNSRPVVISSGALNESRGESPKRGLSR